MPAVEFEPAFSVLERVKKVHAQNRATSVIGTPGVRGPKKFNFTALAYVNKSMLLSLAKDIITLMRRLRIQGNLHCLGIVTTGGECRRRWSMCLLSSAEV
jgi:hypothetical protein